MQLPSNTFCVLPFIHTVLNPYNSVEHNVNALPCCRYSHTGSEKLENIDTINKSPTWIKLQKQFLNGEKPEGCEHCWRDESHKVISYRQINLLTFKTLIMSETIVIDNIIFSYIGSDGKKYYTPSAEFAAAQARKYGTEDIFVEKY